MHRSPSALASLAALALALPCTAAGAQREPTGARLSLLVGAGTGSAPDLGTWRPNARAAALLASAGARVRAGRGLFVDATAHATQSVSTTGEDAIARSYSPGVITRELPRRLRQADVFAAADVRAGYESLRGGAALRGSAGAGYLWTVGVPYAALAAGVGSEGRCARLTLDLEHRVLRIPIDELTGTTASPFQPVVTGTTHAARQATFVRLGVEVPLAR